MSTTIRYRLSTLVNLLTNHGSIGGVVGKEPDIGITAKTVAANVKRLRDAQNMNYTQLSEQLQKLASWSINAVGIRRIEAGERRVTPDDLLALAVALGVSPPTLLMPPAVERSELVTATAVEGEVPAELLWRWLSGGGPAPGSPLSMMAFGDRAWPAWENTEFAAVLDDARRAGAKSLGDD